MSFLSQQKPRIPKPLSQCSKAPIRPERSQQETDENSCENHRHSRSYGRVPPNQTYKVKNSGSPAIPTGQLKTMQDKFSLYEHKELAKFQEVFYLGIGRCVVENNWDDREGYYRIYINDHINYRYQIVEELGQGTFGNVVKCKDVKTDEMVAIKILKKSSRVLRIGREEIEIFNTLQGENVAETCIVTKFDHFTFRGHLCIVFELLSMNLYDLIKKNNFKGLHCNFIRRVATQILLSLKHSHSLGIVHCDLKPENLVLKHENKSNIKLIDFGSAWTGGSKEFYIQSRFYRAPEVILQADWNEKIDIWSLGCIIAELVTGWPLFTGGTELDVLYHIIFILGPPEKRLFQSGRAKITEKYDEIVSDYEKSSDKTCQSIRNCLPRAESSLVDFVEQCLKWDKDLRPSADEALGHCWIKGVH